MRCPACRAENTQGPTCRRCKADLGLLFDLEHQREEEMRAARASLASGQLPAARGHAEVADEMRGDAESRKLAALGAMLCGDFETAWQRYRSARGT